ncbi:winged helix DNA-binding domain-containing protein [Actinokineospora sp. HUAS TT18]|uniref:winged helix DNA-binding domain-containing protein n=1 Tax=Actinokineospora sp. HUAS TT18 TaxID=3447451 RepID=UPI003F51C33C
MFRRRLARHHLTTPTDSLVTAASDVCGIHAQVMSAAEVSLGLRVAGATRVGVRAALAAGDLVKTYGMRGTVHLFPAAEEALWMAALDGAVLRPNLPGPARMTDAEIDTVITAIGDALTGRALTIDELSAEVVERAGPWAGELTLPGFNGFWPKWRSVIQLAAYRGVLRFGPDRGRKVTYTRPEQRERPDHALIEVCLRYLRAYGPVTPQNFARWVGMAPAEAVRLFAALGDRVRPTGDGVELDEPADEPPPCGVRLLPYFDCYTVGSHPRDRVFPGVAAERALSRGQAGTVPVLLVDGVVAGIWHQKRSGTRTAVTVEAFGRLTKKQSAEVEAQAARIGEITEATPTLTFGGVTAGKHL